MKFDKLIRIVLESGSILEEDEFGRRGRKTKAAGLSPIVTISLDPQFKEKYRAAAEAFFKKSPKYLLGANDRKGLPIDTVDVIGLTVKNLSAALSDNNNEIDVNWLLDKKSSPLLDSLKAALETVTGKKLGNLTALGYTGRVVRNFLLAETDVISKNNAAASDTASDTASSKSAPKPVDSMIAPAKKLKVARSIVEVKEDVRNIIVDELSKRKNSSVSTVFDRAFRVLRAIVIKGIITTESDLLSAIAREFKEENITVSPSLFVNSFKESGVLVPATADDEAEDDDSEEPEDDEDKEVPDLEIDDPADDPRGVDPSLVSRYTGGFGPERHPGDF